jgi:hypothetical protein
LYHARGAELLKKADIERAQLGWNSQPEPDQPEQQDEAAESEIDGHFPSDALAFARSPDTDEQKGRNEGEFVEGVEEEKIDRSERANRAGRDEKQARIEHTGELFDFRRDPDGGEGDECGKKDKDEAESIRAKREMDTVGGEEGLLADELESADPDVVGCKEIESEEQVRARAE